MYVFISEKMAVLATKKLKVSSIMILIGFVSIS